MYELKQAVILAYKKLVKNFKIFGYSLIEETTGMWEHSSKSKKFALCVDNFGVKYFSKDDALHLIDSLKQTTLSEKTGQGKIIVVLKLIGTMTKDLWAPACQSTYKMH